MTDPITMVAASVIANLAFQEFIKSGAGELAKKFTAEAIAKINELRKMIVEKLQGKSQRLDEALVKAQQGDSTALDTITKNLDVMMDDEPEFATQLRVLAKEISAGKIRQVGLENFEAGELEAEIGQKTKTDSTANIDQTGATGVKVTGKATIKVDQNIE